MNKILVLDPDLGCNPNSVSSKESPTGFIEGDSQVRGVASVMCQGWFSCRSVQRLRDEQ